MNMSDMCLAFCNMDGGTLFIGIDDKGEVVGVEQAEKLIEKLPNFIAQKTGITPIVQLHDSDGKEYVSIECQPSVMPISVHGPLLYANGERNDGIAGKFVEYVSHC